VLPPTATLLAGSATCPVQMFRVKQNLYATQFHPELDVADIVTRIRIYQHHGYYPPETMHEIIDRVSRATVTWPPRILANFVARYA
jgi:GMP synthase (glutamine-hydrolysing)